MKTKIILLSFIILSFSQFLFAQTDVVNYPSFTGKNSIDLHFGLFDNSGQSAITISSTSVTTNSTNGFMGSLSYQYWIKEYLSAKLSLGALLIETKTTTGIINVSTETATLMPILIGVNFYPLQISRENNVLPYVSLAAGPYIGTYTKNEVAITRIVANETVVESTFGLRIGGGVDFLIGSIFKMGLGVAYHSVSDFKEPIGGDTNYDGTEYLITIGFVF